MSQSRAMDSLIDPVLDALQVVFDCLKPDGFVDNVQRHVAVQLFAGASEPLLCELLITEHMGSVFQNLCVLECHSALL
ncbi:hypothetical protein SAMN05444064_118115 [Pseudomonas syringae]|nr:hypothetical protein SAMN05444514_118115 [Pseudomonas syringae]SFM48429.1 hypothetical protein SAMN05444064_118115 [Pseudomonas syringae]